jgi:hypothetical protein
VPTSTKPKEPDLSAVWATLRERWISAVTRGPDPHATHAEPGRTVDRVKIARGSTDDAGAQHREDLGYEVYRGPVPAIVAVLLQERNMAPQRSGEWIAVKRTTAPYTHRSGGKRTNLTLTHFVNERLGLSYQPQAVSQWATGTDRTPPWRAILVVAEDLGLDVLIGNDGSVYLVPTRARQAS